MIHVKLEHILFLWKQNYFKITLYAFKVIMVISCLTWLVVLHIHTETKKGKITKTYLLKEGNRFHDFLFSEHLKYENDTLKKYLPNDLHLFKHSVQRKANSNKTIIILVVDVSYIDMAINLHETSFKKHNINHYIFLCAHRNATEKLKIRAIDAITAWNDINGEISSNYGSSHFSRKNIYKTIAAFLSLQMGYNVVVMDTDIIFLKNPFPHLTCNDCDMNIFN